MVVPVYSTGAVNLPDTGALSYNGISFGLYHSKASGQVVPDDAKRTTKYVEWQLEVSGVVTLKPGQSDTDATWVALRQQLSVHGAPLIYKGNGFGGLVVNVPGGPLRDVAFGPVPEVLTFTPLGQGRSALIDWRVTTRVGELPPQGATSSAPVLGPVLQFNYECSLGFDEDGYSSLDVRGVLEVPLTRTAVANRVLTRTVDDYRRRWLNVAVDLTKFRVTHRSFDYSRDKRTVQFVFRAEELSPAGPPLGLNTARGTMSVRPLRLGGTPQTPTLAGAVRWLCSLHATYTITKAFPSRLASLAFYALWRYRMKFSILGDAPTIASPAPPGPAAAVAGFPVAVAFPPAAVVGSILGVYDQVFGQDKADGEAAKLALPVDFGFEEGVYLDSKVITFQASWVITTSWTGLLNATGVWRYMPGTVGGTSTGANLWAASVGSIMGSQSWLENRLDPRADVIVDLGGGGPPTSAPF